jgi:hypothetical protein
VTDANVLLSEMTEYVIVSSGPGGCMT